jgi:cobalt-zinc-cadmium efflux system membrane fusion protein
MSPRTTIPLAAALLLTAGLTAAACGGAPAPTPAPAADANAGAAAPSDAAAVVHIDAAMAASLRIDPVTLHTVPRELRTTGKVQFDETRIARLLAPVAGQVTGLTVGVGAHVRQGEAVFYLRSRDASSAIEDHLDAERDLDLSQKTVTITQDLYDHQGASRLALEQALNDLAKSRAHVDRTAAALATLGLKPAGGEGPVDARIPVDSPITGAVIERHISDGQFVQPDPNPLLVIADLSSVWVEADAFERDIHLLRTGQSAEVTTAAYPDEQFRARVELISDVLDPATRTVKVRFLVTNPAFKLKPEMFATVTLFVEEQEQALIIPASAVLTEGDRTFVYVATGDRTFARRPVEIAAGAADTRRVVHGLQAGDRVVTSGVVQLRGLEDRGGN